ncbi:MAG: SCO family protein, partial [Verrucomicrobia bacterium]|nr:SCO family protein [Verrucomicrobiota bacterium]
SGKSVQLADFAGKVWVADFFYSTCPGPCPMLSSRLSDVQKEFASAADLRLVSISIDPEKDTPAVLQAYATKFKANDRWIFLTGEKAAIYRLAREGFKVPLADRETPDGLITHSARLMLIDQTGTVRGFYEAENQQGMADLFAGIRTLLSSKP